MKGRRNTGKKHVLHTHPPHQPAHSHHYFHLFPTTVYDLHELPASSTLIVHPPSACTQPPTQPPIHQLTTNSAVNGLCSLALHSLPSPHRSPHLLFVIPVISAARAGARIDTLEVSVGVLIFSCTLLYYR